MLILIMGVIPVFQRHDYCQVFCKITYHVCTCIHRNTFAKIHKSLYVVFSIFMIFFYFQLSYFYFS